VQTVQAHIRWRRSRLTKRQHVKHRVTFAPSCYHRRFSWRCLVVFVCLFVFFNYWRWDRFGVFVPGDTGRNSLDPNLSQDARLRRQARDMGWLLCCLTDGAANVLTVLSYLTDGAANVLTVLCCLTDGAANVLTVLCCLTDWAASVLTVLCCLTDWAANVLTVLCCLTDWAANVLTVLCCLTDGAANVLTVLCCLTDWAANVLTVLCYLTDGAANVLTVLCCLTDGAANVLTVLCCLTDGAANVLTVLCCLTDWAANVLTVLCCLTDWAANVLRVLLSRLQCFYVGNYRCGCCGFFVQQQKLSLRNESQARSMSRIAVWASTDKVLYAAKWFETKYSSKTVTGNKHSINFTPTILFQLLTSCRVVVGSWSWRVNAFPWTGAVKGR